MGTFGFSDKPSNHYYLFDSEFEGYDFIEKNGQDLIGRKFKLGYRIDELRDKLLKKYGEGIDYTNPAIYQEALADVEAMYNELKINIDLPRDLEAFIGIKGGGFSTQRTPVLTVYEHYNSTGSAMVVETAPHTVIWNYGPWNCYTMAANPNLTQEYQPNGNNWNDCISSKYHNFVTGADAMGIGFYKDINYAVYGCAYFMQIIYKNNQYAYPGPFFNMTDQLWGGAPFCGHINDQISSIRIKAVWQGCPVNFYDLE